jgi:hypothetical protein
VRLGDVHDPGPPIPARHTPPGFARSHNAAFILLTDR